HDGGDGPRAGHQAAAEPQGVPAEAMLPMPALLRPLPRGEVRPVEEVEERRALQAGCCVRLALLVEQEREGDPRLVAEGARVRLVAEPDGRDLCPRRPETLLVGAQLRDV